MQEAAKLKDPDVEYKGIVFDTDFPDLYCDVPRGGRDVQDEKVCWCLPGGQCAWLSLRELEALPTHDLLAKNTSERYAAIAKELHWQVLGLPHGLHGPT